MSFTDLVQQPSAEQCSKNEKVYEDRDYIGVACWYPQMGGYVGKAIVFFDKDQFDKDQDEDGCIEVLVWHDGEFPFFNGENPRELHHCSADQFIRFGEFLKRRGKKKAT